MLDVKLCDAVDGARHIVVRRVVAVFLTTIMTLGGGCQRPAASPGGAAASTPATPLSAREPQAEGPLTGGELYGRHCSACHGAEGDGQGAAARSLFPRARNFRTSNFRLVSTVNGVPTPADLDAILVHGIPGTAMSSFPQLPEAERDAVNREVLRLRGAGIREMVAQRLRAASLDDDIDAEELRTIVDRRLAPGVVVAVPDFGRATPALLDRGQEVYVQQNCPRCHGRDGNGATELYLADEEGYPTRPRNLVWEEFKGRPDAASVGVRIRLGLPGTPMAAHPSLSDEQLVALVHYCRGLAREPKWQLTNFQRAQRVLERGFLSPGHPR